MFNHRLTWLVAGLVTGLVCGNAHAGGTDPGITTSQTRMVLTGTDFYLQKVPGTDKMRKVYYFNQLDVDHDGGLERAEVPKDLRGLRLHFLEADWNHNGRISPAEYWMWSRNLYPRYTSISHGRVGVWGR